MSIFYFVILIDLLQLNVTISRETEREKRVSQWHWNDHSNFIITLYLLLINTNKYFTPLFNERGMRKFQKHYTKDPVHGIMRIPLVKLLMYIYYLYALKKNHHNDTLSQVFKTNFINVVIFNKFFFSLTAKNITFSFSFSTLYFLLFFFCFLHP